MGMLMTLALAGFSSDPGKSAWNRNERPAR